MILLICLAFRSYYSFNPKNRKPLDNFNNSSLARKAFLVRFFCVISEQYLNYSLASQNQLILTKICLSVFCSMLWALNFSIFSQKYQLTELIFPVISNSKQEWITRYNVSCLMYVQLLYYLLKTVLKAHGCSFSRFICTFSPSIALTSSMFFLSTLSFCACANSPSVLSACLLCFASFFHFILLFWNHVFTCVSFKPKVWASLARLDVSRYFCSENVFSRMRNCRSVNTVRDLRHLRPLGVLMVGLRRK